MSSSESSFDSAWVRRQFPALSRVENGRTVAYLDGPGGTQTPQQVIEAMSSVLRKGVSNLGGGFASSVAADEIMDRGRRAVADLLNADPVEVSFGQNMTSLTFGVSRALARTWDAGDAIVLTSLDHDANFTPWVLAAEDAGVEVRIAEFDYTTGVLDPGSIIGLLDDRVKLVAVCLASNSLGSVVDVASISSAAHETGALVYVDAVHAGPHLSIDVDQLGADFLVLSSYKFFGPHTGILYGKLAHMAQLDAYKVRPAPSDPPEKWETGTQSFESVAGVAAAVDYLASLGRGASRRDALVDAFGRIKSHERRLATAFINGIEEMPNISLYGPNNADDGRAATFAIDITGRLPVEVASTLTQAGLFVWSGHYYAVNVMDRLGFSDQGGLVRIGFVHYNTLEEVERVLDVLSTL